MYSAQLALARGAQPESARDAEGCARYPVPAPRLWADPSNPFAPSPAGRRWSSPS